MRGRVVLVEKLYLIGAGKALKTYLTKEISGWLNSSYEILGLIDNNPKMHGKQIKIGEREITITGVESLDYPSPPGFIYITSSRFYDEIKRGLISRQIDQDRILPNHFLYCTYLESRFGKNDFYGKGIEIGGPSTLFEGIYQSCKSCDCVNFAVDTVWGRNIGNLYQYNETILGQQIIADATDLSVIDSEKYDFLLSSNNLEHIANPIKAIMEMWRILKKGGVALFVVPNKVFTFDHRREYTPFEHFLEDYKREIAETDLTHLEEILDKHDLSMDIEMSFEEFKERSNHNFENRCLHHHVFSSETLNKVIEWCGCSVIRSGEIFSCFYALGRKEI